MATTHTAGIRLWGRIGTKLYLALGLAVTLTLLSSGVGVYHFEKSGDLSHRASQQVVPVLSGALRAEAAIANLSVWVEGSKSAAGDTDTNIAEGERILESLRDALSASSGVPELAQPSQNIYDSAIAMMMAAEKLIPLAISVNELDALRLYLGRAVESLPIGDVGRGELLASITAETGTEANAALSRFSEVSGTDGVSLEVANLASGNNGAHAVTVAYWQQRDAVWKNWAPSLTSVQRTWSPKPPRCPCWLRRSPTTA